MIGESKYNIYFKEKWKKVGKWNTEWKEKFKALCTNKFVGGYWMWDMLNNKFFK